MHGMIFQADKFHGNELQEINKIKLKKKESTRMGVGHTPHINEAPHEAAIGNFY